MKIEKPLEQEALLGILEGREPELIDLALRLRDWVLGFYPGSYQLVYDSYATSIAFSHTEKLGGAFAHIAIYKEHLNLGFNEGTLLDDHEGILQGSGKLIRHLRVTDWQSFPAGAAKRLLDEAVGRGGAPPQGGQLLLKARDSKTRG